jgi:hypothetical protein
MTELSCDQFLDIAPEFALGLLDGEERADAVDHMDVCTSCLQVVNSLTGVTDQLLVTLAPAVDPPVGFEERVLAPVLEAARPKVRPFRARRLAALAVAACLVAVALVAALPRSASSSVLVGEMRTTTGEIVGKVYVSERSPATVALALPAWAGQARRYRGRAPQYTVRIEQSHGADRILPVTMNSHATWAAALDIDPRTITTVALVDSTGYVWCEAHL